MPEVKLGLTANRTVFNTCIVLLTTHAVRTKLTYWLNYWLADLISVFISVERGNCGSSTANEVQTETHDRHPVFSFNWFLKVCNAVVNYFQFVVLLQHIKAHRYHMISRQCQRRLSISSLHVLLSSLSLCISYFVFNADIYWLVLGTN